MRKDPTKKHVYHPPVQHASESGSSTLADRGTRVQSVHLKVASKRATPGLTGQYIVLMAKWRGSMHRRAEEKGSPIVVALCL